MANEMLGKFHRLIIAGRHYRERQRQQHNIELGERELMLLSLIEKHEQEGGISVQGITKEFNQNNVPVSGATVSTTISFLWKNDFVDKVISRNNPRNTALRLTDKGKDLLNLDKACGEERAKLILGLIPEEDRSRLLGLVEQLTDAFNQA